eukprot:gene16189-22015_t
MASPGYPVSVFMESPSKDFCCPICLDVLNDPIQCANGHSFCRFCLYRTLDTLSSHESNNNNYCPTCRVVINKSNLVTNLFAKNLINSFAIQCVTTININDTETNNSNNNTVDDPGCNWIGIVSDLSYHLTECEYNMIDCTNSNCKTSIIITKESVESEDITLGMKVWGYDGEIYYKLVLFRFGCDMPMIKLDQCKAWKSGDCRGWRPFITYEEMR